MGMHGEHHTPATLTLGKRPDNHHTGGLMDPMVSLDKYGKDSQLLKLIHLHNDIATSQKIEDLRMKLNLCAYK